jgi:chromosome segregation ATPase
MPIMAVTKARSEAIPQLTTLPERVSVLEVKVDNLEEKIDDVKSDIKDMHTNLSEKLEAMQTASTVQHGELATKIKNLEKVRDKWTLYVIILLAFGAGTGWVKHLDIPALLKFVGL